MKQSKYFLSIFFAGALLIPNFTLQAEDHALCDSSKMTVAQGAITGGLIAGLAGTVVYLNQNQNQGNKPSSSQTFWQKVKFPLISVVIPTLLGATLGGYIGYRYTPEWMLRDALHKFNDLKQNDQFVHAADLNQLKYVTDEPNTIYADGKKRDLLNFIFFKRVFLLHKLQAIQRNIKKVIASDCSHLHGNAQILAANVIQLQEKLEKPDVYSNDFNISKILRFLRII